MVGGGLSGAAGRGSSGSKNTPEDPHAKILAKHEQEKEALAKANQQKQIENAYQQMIHMCEVASSKHPEIPEGIFREIAGKIQINHPFNQEDGNAIIAKYGDKGKAAITAVQEELRPKSLTEDAIKLFWNTDKGGPQLGAMAGAGILGFLGYKLTQGAGWLMNILGTIAMAGLGIFLGDKFFGKKDENANLPDFHHPKPEAAQEAPPSNQEQLQTALNRGTNQQVGGTPAALPATRPATPPAHSP